MGDDVVLVIVVATALAFGFTNGFHDTANVIGTSISTKAMSPRMAVAYTSILNFAGAFISLAVAATIAEDVIDAVEISPTVVVAPIAAFLIGAIAIALVYRIVGGMRPGPVTRGFRLGQTVMGGLLAVAHGTNDAQKTMGVITLALVADGTLSGGDGVPFWVVVSAAAAIALGTYSGGLRIIRRIGMRV